MKIIQIRKHWFPLMKWLSLYNLKIHVKKVKYVTTISEYVLRSNLNLYIKFNQWTSSLCLIAVIRDGNVLQLDVDSEINHVVGPLNKKLVNLKEPVFVGGVPGKNGHSITSLIQATLVCLFSILKIFVIINIFSFMRFLSLLDALLAPSLTTRNSFTGCIRNFVIDKLPVSFSKASLVSGAVSVNSCPSS